MAEKSDWESELAKLRPEARRKVEAALKEGLEAELAGEATSPDARLATPSVSRLTQVGPRQDRSPTRRKPASSETLLTSCTP